MSHRFFLDAEILDGNVTIEGDQAHHALQVMRFQVGDQVILFDGDGTEHLANIVETGKKRLHLAIQKSKRTPPVFSRQLTIAVALPKGDRQKFLIEKLVELGVSRLIPLKTTRSVAVANPKVIERFRRQVIEASKQCGRNFLLNIEPEKNIDTLLDSTHAESLCLIADPYSTRRIGELDPRSTPEIIIAIGPEGGFDEVEMQQMHTAGWNSCSLGPTILRIETAAIAAAALLGIGLRTRSECNDRE